VDEASRTVAERFSVHANRDVYLRVLDSVFTVRAPALIQPGTDWDE